MDVSQKKTRILMFPGLAYGHISPFLELAKKLTKRNFHIYLCSTPVNLKSIQPKISPEYSNSIQFIEHHLPSLPELPPHYHTTNGLPHHLGNTLMKALEMSSPGFDEIIKTLKPDLLIYDFFQPWSAKVASSNNLPAVHFMISSVVMTTLIMHSIMKPDQKFPFPELYIPDFKKPNEAGGDRGNEDRIRQCFELSSSIILTNSFAELEGKYMDYLSVLTNKKMIPTGLLVHDPTEEGKEDDERTKEFLEWLNKKNKSSTVFVSFGSEYYLSKQQREEMAYGLELSGANFIWVVRFPGGEELKLEEALPEGFLQRLGERGWVVEGWAPQAKILQHPSIGGFVSHCGWNSVMESLKFGIPIIATPMNFGQPFHARLVADVGFGLEVHRNKDGNFGRENIAKVIKEVVFGKDAETVKRRAKEMSNILKRKGEEEMDEVAKQLIQICGIKPTSSN